MKAKAQPVPAAPGSLGGITIHNRLQPGDRCAAAMDEVFRIALRDLLGPWDVSVYSTGPAWFRIDLVAPDGASWSTSVPFHGGPRPEELAETVRTACLRHARRKSTNSKRRAGKPVAGSLGDRGGGPQSGSRPGGVTSEPSPAAPEGTPK